MLDNSRLYNGDNHVITDAAKKVLYLQFVGFPREEGMMCLISSIKMFELASKRLVEKEQQLMKLEKAINPLLDDNDRVNLTKFI